MFRVRNAAFNFISYHPFTKSSIHDILHLNRKDKPASQLLTGWCTDRIGNAE